MYSECTLVSKVPASPLQYITLDKTTQMCFIQCFKFQYYVSDAFVTKEAEERTHTDINFRAQTRSFERCDVLTGIDGIDSLNYLWDW